MNANNELITRGQIRKSGLAAVVFQLLTVFSADATDETWRYAVEVSAQVQPSPPSVTLSWYGDSDATGYTIYRKTKESSSWGTAYPTVPGSQNSWVDTAPVSAGSTYEYKIVKATSIGLTGYGYVLAGIQPPAVLDSRGKIVLIIENLYASQLASELDRLKKDLAGDGWTVLPHEVSRTDTPASVKQLIINDYNSDSANVKAVLLFGHVPIFRSGNLNPDGHAPRPLPSDAYYGDVTHNWGNGSASYTFPPANVNVSLDRITVASGTPIVSTESATFKTTGTLPAPLRRWDDPVRTTPYYVRKTSATVMEVYHNKNDAVNGVNRINLTTTGSGTHTLISGGPESIPSDLELQVGRVDLWDLGCIDPSELSDECENCDHTIGKTPDELELLRNYLNKNHNFRNKQGAFANIPRQALVGDRFGISEDEAYAASGYRSFAPMFGYQNIADAVADDFLPGGGEVPVAQRWISMLDANVYLWAYGCGGGDWDGMAGLGLQGDYHFVKSRDIYGQDAQAVFTMFFGSWLVEWDRRGPEGWQCYQGNPMRTMLATPTYGLASSWSGRPHLNYHHMGLGEPIGYSIRLSQNNNGVLYQHQNNVFPRGIHLALHGDPTLRLHPVKPPSNVKARLNTAGVNLTWTASPDATDGYYVYVASSPYGPFTRLTVTEPAWGTAYTHACATAAGNTYMVRAVRLESSGSGTYYNPSQGAFAAVQNDLDWVSRPEGPGARVGHSTVIANNEIIIWGGGRQDVFLNDGGRFNLTDKTWTGIAAGGPSGRWFHSAVWTGSKMVVWGGRGLFLPELNVNTGAIYDPAIGWGSMNSGPLSARSQASAIWTGSEMIVWGGTGDGFYERNDGARFNPVTQQWQMLPTCPLEPRFQHTAVWTGTDMIIYGGLKVDGYIENEVWTSFANGARYNLAGNSWYMLPALPGDPAPPSRTAHTAVWTGQEMIIWGGRNLPSYTFLNTGFRYKLPPNNSWTALPTGAAPQGRADHAAVWTGSEMIVWGGYVDATPLEVNTGGHYSPACNVWLPTSLNSPPSTRYFGRPDSAVWANNAMFVYGGWYNYPYEANVTWQYQNLP